MKIVKLLPKWAYDTGYRSKNTSDKEVDLLTETQIKISKLYANITK
jgi:hypothetical protein